MTNKVLCPVCNSDKAEHRRIHNFVKVPYGPACKYTATEYRCLDCGEQGDFTGEVDIAIEQAIARSNQAAVPVMIDGLNLKGITDAHFERVLRLSFGTVKGWRLLTQRDRLPGEIQPVELALLRAVRMYPRILSIIDRSYNRDFGPDE